MKKITTLLIMFVVAAYSQTYYMNVYENGGGITSISLQEIQKLTFSDITYVGNEKYINVIKTFKLLQNYPNPFNPNTTIEYYLPIAGDVGIKIFNINGELIRELENTYQTSGSHSIIWDAKNNNAQLVSSGVYIYQVAFEGSILSKKMLFIK
jgi:flagellar hook assembly protein FlgD